MKEKTVPSTRDYYFEYHLKDHLGKMRLSFKVSSTSMDVVQVSDCYPVGMSHTGNLGGDNKYLYNGKELQDEQLGGVNLDWYDYGARIISHYTITLYY